MADFPPATPHFASTRLFDANSLAVEQSPTGLGVANAHQIEFGAAKNGDGFSLDELGTLTITKSGYYTIKAGLQFGRDGSGGTSELWFYLTLNGVQAGKSIVYDFDKAADTHYLDYDTTVYAAVGSVIKGFICRDLSADNSGGLYQKVSSESLNTAPCATLRLDRLAFA